MRLLPILAAWACFAATSAGAQDIVPASATPQTPLAALEQDAGVYAARYGVTITEALGRLEAQEASVPAIDRLAVAFRDRLAGIVVEQAPVFRFAIHLTGTDVPPDQEILAAGRRVPVVFVAQAAATRDAILAAIALHQADLRAALPHPPGMGVEAGNGTLAVMVHPADVGDGGTAALAARLEAIAGLPITLRTWPDVTADTGVEGGGRVTGTDAAAGRRFVCTSGFVVTDGTRTGITTAAHCPDDLSFVERGRDPVPLTMIGAWGARYQDVQIHVAAESFAPTFHPDTDKDLSRPLASWRNRTSTRTGDFVCHRGERTGYSCAEVAFVDFAPPGDLCAGPCEPLWVAVRGPGCKSGDSGGPVFLGTIAFGTVKGASYTADGACRLYYYMSTDYLPPGWTLLRR